ncbi:MAG: hypothetical protein ACC628_28015 [Pirellulaceae bacterium]
MSGSFRFIIKQSLWPWWTAALAGALVVLIVCDPTHAIEKRYWELSPYTIHIQLAVDDSARSRPTLDTDLAAYLEQRILRTLHPLWSVELEIAQGRPRHLLLDSLSTLDGHLTEQDHRFDKQMFLTVVAGPEGYTLACREWDKYTRLWGPVIRRRVRQELMLPEQCFALLRNTFAPLAMVRADSTDVKRATLVFKGSELPRRTEEAAIAYAGEVFQPLLIRFDHTGEVRPDGISVVPWTYLTLNGLTLDESENDDSDKRQWQSTVHSGLRRPFGVRRRGRSEHLAIALRNSPGTTRVRFYARHDKSQGLSGYEVFRRFSDDAASEPLGLTDATGSVEVEPVDGSVVTLFLRSDGQLLAKVPVPPGAQPFIEVPIADDTARLLAQAKLTALREQLIDVVARRNILMARVRNRLEESQIDEARNLLGELDDLPGRAQFDQRISSAERDPDNVSQDPRVQQRIEKLFAETRKLLGRFLGIRQISELRSEVNAAARGIAN